MAQVQINLQAISKLKNILCSNQISIGDVSEEEIAKNQGIICKNKYYWLDCNLKLNVELLARALEFTEGSWIWKKEEFHGMIIEVAELLESCKFNVQGCQETKILSPCTEYEVLFDIKVNPCASGWCAPVNFSLTRPDGSKTGHQEKLVQYIGKGYVEIPVGNFTTNSGCGCKDKVEFSMYEHGGHPKSGLVVRGVIIRALN